MANTLQSSLSNYQQQQRKTQDMIMANTLTPKKAHQEQRKLLFQTFFFIILSLILMVLMVFVIVPGLIRMAGVFSGNAVFQSSDTLPPSIPQYPAPPTATKEQKIAIEGYGEPKSTVILVVNNEQQGETVVTDDGQFKIEVGLSEGDNTIALFAHDEAKNESALGKQYTVKVDMTMPELTVEAPTDGRVVTNLRERLVEVKGKVSEKVRLTLNDRLVSQRSDLTFSDQFQLQEGENTLTIKAIDPAGNEVSSEVKVTFRP